MGIFDRKPKAAKDEVDISVEQGSNNNEVVEKIKAFISAYKFVIISILAFAIIYGGFYMFKVQPVQDELTKAQNLLIKNENVLATVKSGTTVKQKVVRDADVDLSTKRWAIDDKDFYNWVKDAFDYDNLTEYNDHRDKYITKLGSNHVFVKNILPEKSVSGEVYSGNNYIGDAEDLLSSSVKEMVSYIYSIDGDKYTYVAKVTVKCNSYQPTLKSMQDEQVYYYIRYTIKRDSDTADKYSIDVKNLTANKSEYERK